MMASVENRSSGGIAAQVSRSPRDDGVRLAMNRDDGVSQLRLQAFGVIFLRWGGVWLWRSYCCG